MPPWIKKNQVFVIMPFSGGDIDDRFEVIQEACSNKQMIAVRADQVFGSGMVMRKIYKLILESEFIITDLTESRPNVYFELGFALGVGNLSSDVLLIAKKGTELHFDMNAYHVELYETKEQLKALIESSLQKMKAASPNQLRRWSIQFIRKITHRMPDA
jgi:hypothetical protein